MNKHNLGYDLMTDSYYRKPNPSPASAAETVAGTASQAPSSASAAKTVNETINQPANRAINSAKDTLKTAAQESTQKAAPVTNQVNKNGSGMLKKGMEWAGRHKVGLGAAAVGTAALAGGGAYLYNKVKKKNQDENNN
jgi:hypothetical protein